MEFVVDLEKIYVCIKVVDKEFIELVKVIGIGLFDLFGIGFFGAVRLLVEVGDIIRFFDCGYFVFWIGIVFIDVFFGDYVCYWFFCGGNC